MSYRVLILKQAVQDFDALPSDQRGRIAIQAWS
jgi:hypothetical protein